MSGGGGDGGGGGDETIDGPEGQAGGGPDRAAITGAADRRASAVLATAAAAPATGDDAWHARLLAALDDPVQWPDFAAEALCPDARWSCPARGVAASGAPAVLAQWRHEARLFASARPVVLRRGVAGTRLIHESALAFELPATGVPGVPLAGGTRVELNCTRVLQLVAGRIAEERRLEVWTPLPPAR